MPRSVRGSSAHRSAMRARGATSAERARSPSPPDPGDLLGHFQHLLARLESALGVDAVDVAGVEGDQPARRVEHVGGGRIEAVGVADGVGQHRRHALVGGEAEHASSPGRVVGAAVGDHLDEEVLAGRDRVAPPGEHLPGEVGTAHGERPAELGGRAEQDEQAAAGPAAACTCSAIRSSVVTGLPRSPRRWVAETSRHSAAQPTRSWASRVTRGWRGSTEAPPRAGSTARVPDRRSAACPGWRSAVAGAAAERPQRRMRRAEQPARLDRQVDAEDRPQARRRAACTNLTTP